MFAENMFVVAAHEVSSSATWPSSSVKVHNNSHSKLKMSKTANCHSFLYLFKQLLWKKYTTITLSPFKMDSYAHICITNRSGI